MYLNQSQKSQNFQKGSLYPNPYNCMGLATQFSQDNEAFGLSFSGKTNISFLWIFGVKIFRDKLFCSLCLKVILAAKYVKSSEEDLRREVQALLALR